MANAVEAVKRRGSNAAFQRMVEAQRATTPPAGPQAPSGAGATTSAVTPGQKLDAAMAAYKREAQMTPVERARRDVLKDKKLTEEQIAAMSAADHEATEKMIAEEVAKRLKRPQPIRTDQQVTVDAFIKRHTPAT
ncbi:hypothetical protein [Sphingomonas insulae]|uniref:hypothetical protein n=1 Tax=Sphingomonas insulae TaxID=424800 RepID=UPI00141B83B7|nr:hypothetical protein [Sphingomonas insulae]